MLGQKIEGQGTYWLGQKIGDPWTFLEKKHHINVLELKAVKYGIQTFTHLHLTIRSIYEQMDNIVEFSYLVKIQNKVLSTLSKEI